MSWYSTKEEAAKAAEEKEIKFKEKFIVIKDNAQPNCYWAQRKSALNDK